MSVREDMLIQSDIPVADAASMIADILGLQVFPKQYEEDSDIPVGGPAATTPNGRVVILVDRNVFVSPDPGPDEISAYDYYPLSLNIWCGVWGDPRPDREEVQRREARRIFELMIGAWPDVPMLLGHDGDFLVASYLPDLGVHEFPPKTTPDAPDTDVWRPWVSEPEGKVPGWWWITS